MRGDLCSHARIRSQQRSVPEAVVDFLEQFGTARRCGGASRYSLTKRDRLALTAPDLPRRDRCEIARYANCFAIIADNGLVITVGHRIKRFKQS